MPSELSVIENLVKAVETSLEVTTKLHNRVLELERTTDSLILHNDELSSRIATLETSLGKTNDVVNSLRRKDE